MLLHHNNCQGTLHTKQVKHKHGKQGTKDKHCLMVDISPDRGKRRVFKRIHTQLWPQKRAGHIEAWFTFLGILSACCCATLKCSLMYGLNDQSCPLESYILVGSSFQKERKKKFSKSLVALESFYTIMNSLCLSTHHTRSTEGSAE